MRVRIGGTLLNVGLRQGVVSGLLTTGILLLVFWSGSLVPSFVASNKSRDLLDAIPVDKALAEIMARDTNGESQVVVRKVRMEVPPRRKWPSDAGNPFRMDDLQSSKSRRKSVVPVAMDAVVSKRSVIQRAAQDLIRGQRRAPDSRYNINVTNSDLQSLDRDVPDIRPPICKHFNYDIKTLPAASIIIPFYNEALTMLLRTIHSILNRSPDSLLTEIILVDDCSTDDHLKSPLDRYIRLLPKVTIIRNTKRVGLIVSRMTGARAARGPVLIFLDAHTEANHGWLEPLLDEIKRNRKQVLQPFIDAIDAMTLDIGPAGVFHKSGFSWDLRSVSYLHV